jgi:hypothetical protein
LNLRIFVGRTKPRDGMHKCKISDFKSVIKNLNNKNLKQLAKTSSKTTLAEVIWNDSKIFHVPPITRSIQN